jgi:hypothetical protein
MVTQRLLIKPEGVEDGFKEMALFVPELPAQCT